jgi:large subunit ribosomal protein L13
MFKTYSMKQSEVDKKWHLIDASGLVLGRLAVLISMMLRGKHNPAYTPSMDCGDNIVVINAEKIILTGNKSNRLDGKVYYRHTGHPGGIKEITAGKVLESKFPGRVLELAVQRMMQRKSPLGRQQFTHLHVYAGSTHPHEAQQPQLLDVAAMNKKNSRK